MFTVEPPLTVLPIINETLAFCFTNWRWRVSFTRYLSIVLFHSMPNESSKAWQASIGSQMCGIEESMNVKRPAESSSSFVVVASLNAIDCNPTTKSREISLAIVKATSFGVNLEASYPPKVREALPLFGPFKSQSWKSRKAGVDIRYCAPAE